MTDAATLRALIERVEQATGADRRLDGDIETALGWPFAQWTGDARPFTSSLDAAASLVPEGWQWVCGKDRPENGGAWADVQPNAVGVTKRRAATPALALTAAALGARLAEMRRAMTDAPNVTSYFNVLFRKE
jgi:hypothetical protein